MSSVAKWKQKNITENESDVLHHASQGNCRSEVPSVLWWCHMVTSFNYSSEFVQDSWELEWLVWKTWEVFSPCAQQNTPCMRVCVTRIIHVATKEQPEHTTRPSWVCDSENALEIEAWTSHRLSHSSGCDRWRMRRKRRRSRPPDCSPCYFTADYTDAYAHQAAIMTLKEQNKLQSEHQMCCQLGLWLPDFTCSLLNFLDFLLLFLFGLDTFFMVNTVKGHRTNWITKISSQLLWWRSEWKPEVGFRDHFQLFCCSNLIVMFCCS